MTGRLPWLPVESRLSTLFDCPRHQHGCTCLPFLPAQEDWYWVRQQCWSMGDAAEKLGVTRRTIARWISGGLTWHAADRVATILEIHPNQLWPEWEAVSLEAADRFCQVGRQRTAVA